MSELDKFKRRTIRSVARLLLKEKKPPEELWKQMKKETGTDCQTLWERMRALCVKKLNRMIAADDRSANLPGIARLSLTDWLLVDLVLVHEEIDVIAIDQADNKEYPALIELFNLVQRFEIEGRFGELLAEAWAAATVFYNRQGRQCSPMLLQRRWYQLKKLTRCRFYKFWFSYRGNTRLLQEARKSMPTRLQMAIAKRYPDVITKEYPDWEDLIEKRYVIMPEEFEAKMRMPNLPKPCNSKAPDLVLVEPVIETIDLRVESDHEDHHDDEMEDNSDPDRSNDATDMTHPPTEEEIPDNEQEIPVAEEDISVTRDDIPVNDETSGIQVKTEAIEDGLSNVQLISATHVPEVEISDQSPDETTHVVTSEVNTGKGPGESSPNDDEDDIIELPSVAPSGEVEHLPTDNIAKETEELPPNIVPYHANTIDDSDEAVDDIIKVRADEFCRKKDEVPVQKDSTIDDLIKDKVESYLRTPKDISISDKKPENAGAVDNMAEVAAIDLMADLNFVDDGIEFVDDGVEFVEEDHVQNIESTTNVHSDQIKDSLPPADETNEENNTFDLKLLMYPVVYTTKLDQMNIFKNKQIDSVKGIGDIDMAVVESKPVSKKSFDIKIKEESVTNDAEDTVDNSDLFTNREVTDDEDMEEDVIVSPNSYMLRKPRTRTYDPIKLCKNPDFNTKLKRLTIGFLSSSRNRQLLNACIPMTIDLSKAFEPKLVHGTLYLKSSGSTPTVAKQEAIETQASSVVPTAMSVQSLIDNSKLSKVDIQNLISNQSSAVEPLVSERTKVIKLPDIDKVRRINQQLLTAQVPPLRVFAGDRRASDDLPPEVNPAFSTDSNSTQDTLPKIKVEGEKSSDPSVPDEALPPAKEKLLEMIKQAKILTKEALDKIDDATKPKDFPMPIVIKEVKNNIPPEMPTVTARKHYFQPRVPLAWAPKYAQPTKNNFDDFGLLTSDTLNKMLHLLTSGTKGDDGCKCCGIKKKKVNKSKLSQDQQKDSNKSKLSQDQQKDSEVKSSEAVHDDTKKDESEKPAQVTVEKPKIQKATRKVIPVSKVTRTKYCCWASQKLNKRKRSSKHLCPPNPCTCCCADKLVKQINEEEEIRRLQILAARNVVELSDDEEDSLKKARESIETVVQQSIQIIDQGDNTKVCMYGQDRTTVVPNIKVVDRTVIPTAKPVTPSINVEVVSPSVSKITIDLGRTPTEIKETPPKPNIKIRAAPISTLMPADRPLIQIHRPPINKQITNPPSLNRITFNRAPTPRLQMHSKFKAVYSAQSAVCSCQKPALSQDSRRNIVIDASKHCAIHPKPIAPKQIVSPQKTPVKNQDTPNQKQEKILYLHSKSLAKSPSESPIFLGKHKILLTTVKFPRKNEEITPQNEIFQAPKVIPTLPLPAGVQLVLMPSGDVTYTVDPGVELDDAQLAALPTILAAVQEQLNATGVVSSPAVTTSQVCAPGDVQTVVNVAQPETSGSENINLSQNDGAAEMPQAEPDEQLVTLTTNEIFQDTELPLKNTNNDDMEVDSERTKANAPVNQSISPTTTSDLEKETSIVTDDTTNRATVNPEAQENDSEPLLPNQTTSVGEELQNEIQTQETPRTEEEEKAAGDNDGINNRKSLLSDLMQMSGISTEDTTAPEPPAPEPPVASTVVEQVDAANMVVNDETRNLPELSPVTSFAELKYACEQNGKFFKLDFETGIIVPINVCIKKNPKNKTTPKTKEFIDLTDDVENSDVTEPLATNKFTEDDATQSSVLQEQREYLFNGKTVNVSSTVKPVKLFKAFRPAPRIPRVLKAGPIKAAAYESILKQTHVEKRKQNIKILKARVEARIDLVDSDEPMEEEYLMDSSDDNSDDERRSSPGLMPVEALDTTQSDDSSDDEPLAKKSKRLKEVDDKEQSVRETNIFDELSDVADQNELTSTVNELVADIEKAPVRIGSDQLPTMRLDCATKDSIPTAEKNTTPYQKIPELSPAKDITPNDNKSSESPIVENKLDEPIDDQSEDEESDEVPPELRFLSDNSESGEEGDDCILGF